jgi:hypothetical protein
MRDALVAAVHAIAYEDFSASDPFVVAVPDDGLAAFEERLAGLHRALDERVADGLFSPAELDPSRQCGDRLLELRDPSLPLCDAGIAPRQLPFQALDDPEQILAGLAVLGRHTDL